MVKGNVITAVPFNIYSHAAGTPRNVNKPRPEGSKCFVQGSIFILYFPRGSNERHLIFFAGSSVITFASWYFTLLSSHRFPGALGVVEPKATSQFRDRAPAKGEASRKHLPSLNIHTHSAASLRRSLPETNNPDKSEKREF